MHSIKRGAPIHNQITMVYPNYCLRHYHRQQQTTRPFPTLLQQQQQQITLPRRFNRDGSLSKNAFDAIVKIIQIVPSWQDEIMHEINQYQEFEQNWKEAFRAEIKKFVSIHQALEVARMNLDQNYQPVKMTEYQASIEFGGFSNALPKPKFNGKRNLSPTEDHLKQNNNFYNYLCLFKRIRW